jgi:hypothetical protein
MSTYTDEQRAAARELVDANQEQTYLLRQAHDAMFNVSPIPPDFQANWASNELRIKTARERVQLAFSTLHDEQPTWDLVQFCRVRVLAGDR